VIVDVEEIPRLGEDDSFVGATRTGSTAVDIADAGGSNRVNSGECECLFVASGRDVIYLRQLFAGRQHRGTTTDSSTEVPGEVIFLHWLHC
jgi:hypothetical protein